MLRVFVLFTCVLFASCQPDRTTAISKEEAIAAAKRLEDVVLNRSPEGYVTFIDGETFVKKVRKKSHASEKDKNDVKAGPTMKSMAMATIIAVEKGSFHFLRNYEKEGRQHLLFRVITENGFTYQDFSLVKVKNVVKADDIYTYSTGEELSTTLAETLDVLSLNNEKKQTDAVLLLQKKRKQGDHEGVKEMYESLPAEYQQSKALLLIYIEACSKIDETHYKTALEKFAALYPNAPNSYLLMIDAYIMSGEYEKVFAALNKIDTLVGGDHYLEYFRGNVYRLMGKAAESKACYERAYEREPELLPNIQSLIVVYMEDTEVSKAKKVLAAYKISKTFSQKELDAICGAYPELLN